MAFLNLFSVNVPKGIWETLINGVFGFISNYGLRILIFTTLLKILLFPLDLYQRKTMSDNAKKMKLMEPQLKKLQEQFGHDKNLMQQKQMELYKKEKYSMFSSCLPMIISMVVFLTMYAGLTNISHYKSMSTYETLYYTYQTSYYNDEAYGNKLVTDYQAYTLSDIQAQIDLLKTDKAEDFKSKYTAYQTDDAIINAAYEDVFTAKSGEETKQFVIDFSIVADETEAAFLKDYHNELISTVRKTIAQNSVVDRYNLDQKQSFLWVKSIWAPDVSFESQILTKEKFETALNRNALFGGKIGKEYLKDEAITNMIAQYNDVMKGLIDKYAGVANGYYIFAILAVAFTMLSQWLTKKLQGGVGTPDAMGGAGGATQQQTMKMMMWMMPIMIGYFAISSPTSFAIYMVGNSAVSLILMVLSTYILKLWDKHTEKKEMEKVVELRAPGTGTLKPYEKDKSFTQKIADKLASKNKDKKDKDSGKSYNNDPNKRNK